MARQRRLSARRSRNDRCKTSGRSQHGRSEEPGRVDVLGGEPTAGPGSVRPTPPAAGAADGPADIDLLDAALGRGSRRLRFDAGLERRFQRDCAVGRTARIAVCNALGAAFNWLNTTADAELMPMLAPVMTPLRHATLAFVLLAAGLLFWQRRVVPSWIVDGVTLIGSLLIVGYVLIAAHDPPDHLPVLIRMGGVALIFLHAGVAARLHFRSVLVLGLLTLAGYALTAVGNRPEQAQVVDANLRFFVTALLYALVANYLLEYRERRNYVLRALQTHRHLALADAAEALQRLSLSDPLTGLYNRRWFDRAMSDAVRDGTARGDALAVLQIDVDFFKRYNDHYGHPAGDVCLQRVAEVLSAVSKQYAARAARVGGEEFAMLLPGHTLEAAARAADTVLRRVRALHLPHCGSMAAEHVTVSIGAAAVQPPLPPTPARALLLAADEALYAAKHCGRDRTCLAPLVQVVSAPRDARPEREDPSAFDAASGPPATTSASSRHIAEDETSAALAGRVETLQAVLRKGWRRLRFAPEIEADYASSQASKRGPLLCGLGIGGLLYAFGQLWLSSALIADVVDRIVPIQVVLAVMLVPALLALRRPMSPQRRELLFGACVIVLTLGSALLMAPSRLMTAHTYAMGLFLIPMFSAVIAAQPFRHSLCIVVLGWTFIVVGLAPNGAGGRSLWIEVAAMGMNACLFSLIGSYLIEWNARRDHILTRIAEAQADLLAHSSGLLRQLADRDPLTGLANRRRFDSDFAAQLAACACRGQALGLLIADVDHFKRYNDSLGHPAGDGCLQKMAIAIAEVASRHSASVGCDLTAARIGGEEFALLLPGHDAAAALRVADAVCEAIRRLDLLHPDSPAATRVTASVGVASVVPAPGEAAGRLLRLADEALYAAKHQGRNRAVHLQRRIDADRDTRTSEACAAQGE